MKTPVAASRRSAEWRARPEYAWAFSLPNGAMLRLQRELPFVRMVPGGAFVDLACLKRCGVLVPITVHHGCGVWQPSKAVRAAFVTAQALVEHRFSHDFSFLGALQVAAELDLGSDEDIAFDSYLLVQSDIEHVEFEAWRELIRGLDAGQVRRVSPRARALLEHALAIRNIAYYRLKLRAQQRAQRWQQEGGTERLADVLEKAIRFLRGRE